MNDFINDELDGIGGRECLRYMSCISGGTEDLIWVKGKVVEIPDASDDDHRSYPVVVLLEKFENLHYIN